MDIAGIRCSRCGGLLPVNADDITGGGGDPALLPVLVPSGPGIVPDPLDEDRLCHARHLTADDFDDVATFYEGYFEALDVAEAERDLPPAA